MSSENKRGVGRPTACTIEVTQAICERLAAGESLRSICEEDADMPAVSSVLLWVVSGRLVEGADKEFSEHYMQAREAGGFAHADRVITVIDKVANGEYDPNQARAMLDGLKWAAERMAPKKHSPRQEIDHGSSDGSMSPNRPASELTDDELAAIASAINKPK